MRLLSRRSFALAGMTACTSLLGARPAHATLVRGLTLRAMVARSQHVLVLAALDSYCHQVEIGGRLSIVTDTRVRIDDVVAQGAPETNELIVRTLGGRLGNIGELVHGQPELALGAPAFAFLKRGADGAHWVVGMAQGHFPLEGATPERARLTASRNLPTIRDWQQSAVRVLAGQALKAATQLVRQAESP